MLHGLFANENKPTKSMRNEEMKVQEREMWGDGSESVSRELGVRSYELGVRMLDSGYEFGVMSTPRAKGKVNPEPRAPLPVKIYQSVKLITTESRIRNPAS